MAYETTEQLLAEISDYWDKRPGSNIYKLIDAFNAPLEAIGTNANKVERWRALKDAKGKTLDLFGKDIQTYRPSENDDDYRFMIHIMELLSRAQGTIPSIVKITSSALETDQGFKIWKTGIRHIGMQIPYDAVKSLRMQKFIIANLQKMLAMGYWLNLIVFKTTTHVHGYLGAGTVDADQEDNHGSSIWWEGYTAKTFNHWYFGAAVGERDKEQDQVSSSWWKGWTAPAHMPTYIGVANQEFEETICTTQAKWYDDQAETLPASLALGSYTQTNEKTKIK